MSGKAYRRNITMAQGTIDRLNDIRTETEAASDSEVIRTALQLYERVLKRRKAEEEALEEALEGVAAVDRAALAGN